MFGPRVFQATLGGGVAPGPPAVLGITPLCYELAYGAVDLDDPSRPLIEWRNPAGMGLARSSQQIGTPVPQLEDARYPIGSRTPAPASFGPIASSWAPRNRYAGTFDAQWRRLRAPLLPLDFDPRHYCVAHPDLWSAAALRGDETVSVLGARPEGLWRFRLPRYAPSFASVVAGQIREHATHLDSYQIDADARTVELTWRAAVRLPRPRTVVEMVYVAEQHAQTLEPVVEATRRAAARRRLSVVG